jgi:hypothetical protein
MGLVTADQERGMNWRVIVELSGGDGTVREHEVSAGGSTTIEHSPETIGLTLTEGRGSGPSQGCSTI